MQTEGSPTGNSSSEFDVFALSRFAYASRDMRDVRAVRATSRVRDRSIGRGQSVGPDHRSEARAISGFFPPTAPVPSPGRVSRSPWT